MKALLLFSAAAGLVLNSATPPSSADLASGNQDRTGCPAPACPATATVATRHIPRLIYEPEELPPPPPQAAPAPQVPQKDVDDEIASAPSASDSSDGIKIVVSLPQQKAYVFDDGQLIATSPVSTGKKGYETPAGTFRILQKKVHHRSNRYSNAPMPYMQRLTWQGVALHAGSLPGYPASHGCIRLPRSFAKKLYKLTDYSTDVTITRERPKSPEEALKMS